MTAPMFDLPQCDMAARAKQNWQCRPICGLMIRLTARPAPEGVQRDPKKSTTRYRPPAGKSSKQGHAKGRNTWALAKQHERPPAFYV
jgi:hypothetical protein